MLFSRPNCVLALAVLGVSISLLAAGQELAASAEPARDYPSREELEKKYDEDGDGQLGPEERRKMVDDIVEGRVQVPRQVRENMRRMREMFQQAAKRPGAKGPAKPGVQRPGSRVPENVTIQRDVVFGDGGGVPLKLDLVLPKETPDKPLPLVVFIHGGGWRNGDKATGIGRVAPLVATGGYVGATISYRLSGVAIWPAQIHDCKAAIRWLRAHAKEYHIDPERIGVWGSSAGGHLVNMLGTSGDVASLEGEGGSPDASSRVNCVVPFCGPTNFLAPKRFEGGRSPSAVDLLLGGDLAERQDLARQASPITYVSADDPPFLLVHGTADNTVPFEQAEMFYEALKKAGVNVTFVKIVGGSHAIAGEEVMRRVNAFFDKHLRGQDVEVSDQPIELAGQRG